MNHLAILLLGSNMGDRVLHLDEAEKHIQSFAKSIEQRSNTYTSNAWGKTDQADFLNRVISIRTDLLPDELLKKLIHIEQQMKRVRLEKWGPRIIDLDILLFDDLVYVDEDLKIPHPGIVSRKFTLVPLCELYPDFIHPVYGLSLKHLLDNCKDTGHVSPYAEIIE